MNETKQIQSGSEPDPADIHDRVTEAYYGLIGQQFMRETQNRIHWICRQVQGKSLLDVGCGQGIVPILLAREGFHAIGIDRSPKAIDEANRYLANESKQVRKHVSFVNTDFLSWDHHDLTIDTVVMSEVLEHLIRPECFLETAARILPKKGRLIVTVPFGIDDFKDHKHTFYLLKPLRLVSKHFDVVGVEVLGNWLGIVADRRAGTDRVIETFRPTIALMEKLESAFYQTERILRDELSLTRINQDKTNQKYRVVTEQVATLKQQVAQEESAGQAAKQALGQAAIQLEEANRKYRVATEQVTTLKQQVAQKESACQAAEAAMSLTTLCTATSAVDRKLQIACIMDQFTFSSFHPEAILHQLTPNNWRAELDRATPELLFIESAWRGKDELWGSKVGHTSVEVRGIVEWCRAKKIPTVFWCKEDPIHFETFLNTAKLVDHVFTTDIDCIHRYKAALRHERVYLLPFACQPATTNPIETYERKDAFCFAGAYYVRYPDRTRDLGNFVMELPAFRPLEIYDRNYGKNDPNYQFPEEYRPYIVGTLPFDQIDKAYKGYRYAINLNSIKQSQSMFARRVFELLGSNTITISNFSRGVRLLFGDLVITSDSGHEIVRRLNTLADNKAHSRKLRLAALRKVMREHTYGQRLAYVVSKVRGESIKELLPHIAVLAYAANQKGLDALRANYQRQTHVRTALYVVVGDEAISSASDDARVHLLTREQAKNMVVGEIDSKAELIAGMTVEDYYGPNYLLVIALATQYTQAELIGKAARYSWEGGRFELKQPNDAYHHVQSMPARAAAIRRQTIAKDYVLEWTQSLGARLLQADHGLAIDEFNYCEQGAAADSALVRDQVDDLPGLNTGISIDNLLERAERIAPDSNRHEDFQMLTGKQLAADFDKMPSGAITLVVDDQSWLVDSTLPDGKHEYLYATVDHSLNELGFTDKLKVYFDVTPGLNIQLAIQFLDVKKQKISHVVTQSIRNQEAVIPPGTDRVRFGLRFCASGSAAVKGLVLGHRNLQPSELIGQAEQLVLTNHYPSYSDLYRNGFVHTRVRAYEARAVRCDVFRLRTDEAVSYHEFEDVNVITGSQEALQKLLIGGRYKSVLVHFLDEEMWQVLQLHIGQVKMFVWVHGAEIQPLHRRDNFENEQQRDAAKVQSEARMSFWRGLLRKMPENLKLIFVSNYLAEVVMEDLGFRLPKKQYEVVHNPIDTDLFAYHLKPTEQRKKILSIRPYASRTYANDLSVKAILALTGKPYFKDLEFRMIGDGKLFDEVLAPLSGFSNVYIEKRFLTHAEIAALHREYGIFLCPTRMDTQGVSRDEAMASGLVPVTNAVAAIPEFVDDSCGILAPGEDAEAMARGMALLYEQPQKFAAMSEAAAKRVRAQSDAQRVISAELAIVVDDLEQIKDSVLKDAA